MPLPACRHTFLIGRIHGQVYSLPSLSIDANARPDAMPTSTVMQKPKEKVDNLADHNVDTTDTELRYMAYASRLRTVLRAGHRYVAYVRISHCVQWFSSSDGFTLDQ